MKTITLHGKKAAGRVALVDDEDYELVARFRWNLWECKRPSGSISGPYAHVEIKVGGTAVTLSMHRLVTGYPQTDHIDHDGLNNQRYNLRPATDAQNMANKKALAGTSVFKGVHQRADGAKWGAAIRRDGRQCYLGYFESEEEAARAYDAAAIEAQGEYACLNFPQDAPRLPSDQRQAERDACAAEREAYQAKMLACVPTSLEEWWARRQIEERICESCGATYLSRSTRPSYSCSARCQGRRVRRLRRERLAS